MLKGIRAYMCFSSSLYRYLQKNLRGNNANGFGIPENTLIHHHCYMKLKSTLTHSVSFGIVFQSHVILVSKLVENRNFYWSEWWVWVSFSLCCSGTYRVIFSSKAILSLIYIPIFLEHRQCRLHFRTTPIRFDRNSLEIIGLFVLGR